MKLFINMLVVVTATFTMLAPITAYADWFFRGTPNSWGTTELEFVSGNTYKTCQLFGGNNPLFKIDRFGDWSENYPQSDRSVNANTTYEIEFDSNSHSIITTEVTSCGEEPGFAKNFDSLFFRGTANGWGTTAMTLIADNTWRLSVTFDGQNDQRFKFDEVGNWSNNYGDNNSDQILDSRGSDIFGSGVGVHILEVNDDTLAYSITAESVDTVPSAVIDPSNDQTINLSENLQFDASNSFDAEGSIVSYLWSTGETADSINITFNSLGEQTVSVTVTDESGQTDTDLVTITVQDSTPSDSWFFRGTPNSWGTTVMTSSDNINYCTQQSFGNNDPRFKVDHLGDWTENYPSQDVRVDADSTYDICINSNDKNVTTTKVQGVDTQPPSTTALPSAGSYTATQSITLSVSDNEDQSPQIFYTTDGSTPTTSSPVYNGETITASDVGAGVDLVIKTLAVDVSNNQAEQSFSYFIGEQTGGSGDFREETIYFLLTARFYDGDESNNYYNRDRIKIGDPQWRGDFKGLIQQLDYIKDLGFTAVWVTPPIENRSGLDYHGYHAYDWTKVDPRLESSGATYQDFINAAHDKGLKVIQDVVINHSSQYGIRDKVWIDHLPIKYYVPEGASQGEISNDPYFGNLGDYQPPNRDDNDNSVAPQWFKDRHSSDPDGTTPLVDPKTGTAVPLAGYDPNRFFGVDAQNLDENWYHPDGFMAGGDWENPGSLQRKHLAGDTMDLFTEKQNVRDYLNGAMKMYLDMGVDAIRLDTAKHLERGDLLSYTQNWQAHKPGLFVFGEALVLGVGFGSENGNDNGPAEIRPWWYTRTGSSATNPTGDSGFSVLDFPLFSTFRDNVTRGNFSQVGGVLSMDHFYADPTQLVTFFQNHDLGPDNDFKFRYGGAEGNAALAYNLLWTIRGIPSLYYGEEVQFMAGAPQDIKEADDTIDMTGRAYFGPTLDDVSTSQHNLYKHIKRLNQIRSAIPALQKGPMASTNEWGAGMSFIREFESSYVVVGLAGNSGQSVNVSGVKNGTYRDAVTGNTITVNSGSMSFSVAAFSAGIYILDGPGKIGEDGAYLK